MTIREIAELANVSIATVSKIINHKDNEISDPTRQKVLKIIQEYQYTPYSNLKLSEDSGHTHLLALITHGSAYTSQFIFHVEKIVSQLGYSLILCNLTEPLSDDLRKYMSILTSKRVDGILLGFSSTALLEEAAALNYSALPMAAFTLEPFSGCASFILDYSLCAELSVMELIRNKHTRIACILGEQEPEIEAAVIKGYQKAMGALYHYGSDFYIAKRKAPKEAFINKIHNFLQANVTAFFCQTLQDADIIYDILKDSKYYIPANISVICGEPASYGNLFTPALSTCALPLGDIISAGVEYIANSIQNHMSTKIVSKTFKPVTISGGSIAPPISSGKQIMVIGNCNTDINLRTHTLPQGKDLLFTKDPIILPGGKATAQAIGAGKLGGTVYILGCIGNDEEGNNIKSALRLANVHIDNLICHPNLPTGTSFILVPDTGDSSIIVHPGANAAYQPSHIRASKHLFETCDYCLLSTELSEDVISYTIKNCAKHNIELLLKPSSIEYFSDELLSYVDYLIPNQYELDKIMPGPLSYQEKADILLQKGCRNVIITFGREGCYLRNKDYAVSIPAANFRSVDSTGAANCFIAALVIALSQNAPLLYALCYATYAAGLSTTQPGVQSSFPDKYQMDLYLDDIKSLYHSLREKNCLNIP